MSDKQYNSSETKKSQKKTLIISGSLLTILFGVIVLFSSKDEKPQQVVNHGSDKNISTSADENVSDMEVYTANTQADLNTMQSLVNDLQSRFKAMQENESREKADMMNKIEDQFSKINSQLDDIKNAPPAFLPTPDSPFANGKDSGLPPIESAPAAPPEPQIRSINIKTQTDNESGSKSTNNSSSGSNSQIKSSKTYLPTSFVKAKLITALDAPCGGTSQDNPFPVLLNITGNAQLPNKYKTQLKGCFALASSYGDVASERAYMRLEKISCVGKNGETIDMKAEGYIAGEDGKAGLRGNLVSKAGSKIALALLSGTVGGLASAFAQTATTLQQTPIGPTQIVTPQQSLGYAGATGISQGFQQLSQYYINMAEKTFPVIEINDQRNVTIVFTGGLDFPIDVNTDLDSNKKSIPIMVN